MFRASFDMWQASIMTNTLSPDMGCGEKGLKGLMKVSLEFDSELVAHADI